MTSLVALSLLLALSPGQPLPALKGEFLSGKKATLPDAARGKMALYLIGFSYDSRFPVEAWAARFKQDFLSHSGITFFEVPVIGGLGMLGKPFIDSGMRRGTPAGFHENVLTVYGGVGPLRKAFALKNEKHAVVVLCDRQGNVQWSYEGPFDANQYAALKTTIDRHLSH